MHKEVLKFKTVYAFLPLYFLISFLSIVGVILRFVSCEIEKYVSLANKDHRYYVYKDATCFIESILKTAPYIKSDLWSSSAHFTSHPGANEDLLGIPREIRMSLSVT